MTRNILSTGWRGKLEIPRHASPIVKHLFRLMNEEQTTLTEIGEKSGVQRKTISEWRYSRVPRLNNIEAVGNALGYRLQWAEIDE